MFLESVNSAAVNTIGRQQIPIIEVLVIEVLVASEGRRTQH